MKVLISLILVALTVAFSSCGSDDDIVRTEGTFEGNYTSNNTVLFQNGTIPPFQLQGDQIAIDDMFNGYSYTPPIISGELNYNKSYIQVTGLTDKDILLNNFTVIINGSSKKLGNLNSDIDLSTNDVLTYLDQTLKTTVSSAKLNVVMEFTANKTILAEDNIRLIINYNGTFKYYK